MSKDAIDERRKHLLPPSISENVVQTEDEPKESDDPAQELTIFIKNNPKGDIAAEVKRLQEKYGFTSSKRSNVLFDALFDFETVPSFKKHIPTFQKLFTDKKSRIGLLGNCARLFSCLKNDKAF